ncbi:MAG: NAD(P)H-hydrate dehydratase [Candidatus Eremiobacteraeota bacterium]|nr:NAD(P)H-hydrate dehydratase [Candidatus Eremiobacteraeota bacterium]
MTQVLTPEEMRCADAAAVALVGETQLMRNAGDCIATLLAGETVVAFAGPGNNGGDAFAACATLRERDHTADCTVYADDRASKTSGRRDAELRAHAAGVQCRPFPENFDAACKAIEGATIVLDALFGTGVRLPISEPYASTIRAMNQSGKPVLAVDIPSGVDALSGMLSQTAVSATATIALGALKPGLLLEPARSAVGSLFVADIGIGEDEQQTAPAYTALDDASFLALLPRRSASGDKRSSGAPFIIAGSRQFPGAAILCARAAARAGAGYVTVAAPAQVAPLLRTHLVEQVVTELPDESSVAAIVEQLLDTARHCSAIGIGPGLGLDERTGEIIRAFLRATELPFVADASALFHFAKHLDLLATPRALVTPHSSEFARLSGKGSVAPGERVARLREFVERTHCTTLLKGRTTLIDDGKTVHMNTTGTSALSTAGTGDVLTGIIATLLSQGLAPVDAARAGAYWHGLAGAYCTQERSRGIVAGDLPEVLAAALPDEQDVAVGPLYAIFSNED